MMKLSIIIPVYNVEKYLSRNLDSILNSNIKSYEIILINDGSTDKSYEICMEYEKKYKNIMLINNDNHGQGFERNLGIDKASGEWLLFVDSDDFLMDGSLNRLFEIIVEKRDNDLILFNTFSFIESKNIYEQFTGEIYKDINPSNGIDFFTEVLKKDITYGYPAWFYIVRKSLIDDNLIRFSNNGKSEDVEFTFKIWMSAKSVCYTNCDLYAYRREQPTSTTHNINESYILDLLVRIKTNINYLNKTNMDIYNKDYFILSNFHLLTVAYSMACNCNTMTNHLESSLNEVGKLINVNDNYIIKGAGKRLQLLYFLNNHFNSKMILRLWKLYKRG